MSDTPETDALFFRTDIEWDNEVEFARKLERERDELRQALREIADGDMRTSRARAKKALEEASK